MRNGRYIVRNTKSRDKVSRKNQKKYHAVVMGASAGGLDVLSMILPALRAELPVPVMVVLHISPHSDSFLVTYLDQMSKVKVVEAADKAMMEPGKVYFAPPDYHLMAERDGSLSLSNEEKVNYSRPSIDVLFETALWVFGSGLIGVLLTGANWDGAKGMELIHKKGGYTIIQDPATASMPRMPEAAMEKFMPDAILRAEDIGQAINKLLL